MATVLICLGLKKFNSSLGKNPLLKFLVSHGANHCGKRTFNNWLKFTIKCLDLNIFVGLNLSVLCKNLPKGNST